MYLAEAPRRRATPAGVADLVVLLEADLQSLEDLDGLFHARLVDVDLSGSAAPAPGPSRKCRETPDRSWSRCSAARRRPERLDEIGRIHHAARGRPRADDGVDLVDEQHGVRLAPSWASTALRRFSKSPRYLVPATKRPGPAHRCWHPPDTSGPRRPRSSSPAPRRSRSFRRRPPRPATDCSCAAGTGSGRSAPPPTAGRSADRSAPDAPSRSVGGKALQGLERLLLLTAPLVRLALLSSSWLSPGTFEIPWEMKLTTSKRVMSC